MKKTLVAIGILSMALFSGCGMKDTIDESTIQVNKDQSITGTLVEPFGESYYKLDELESMVNEEVGKYNKSAGDGAVTLGSVEMMDEQTAKVVMTYKAASDYENFNQKTLFVGTVSDAKAKGYAFVEMMAVNGEGTISEAQILEKGDSKLVITEEIGNVKVPGKITYLSGNADPVDKKTAAVKAEEVTYILYE